MIMTLTLAWLFISDWFHDLELVTLTFDTEMSSLCVFLNDLEHLILTFDPGM